MSVIIHKKTFKNKYFTYNAMALIPANAEVSRLCGVFTHGYTTSKTDPLPWAQRLSEAGIPCAIFDLPGHYLGSYNEVENFEDFKVHTPFLFTEVHAWLMELTQSTMLEKHILGGHSLGALLSILALDLDYFKSLDCLAIAVGLGIGQHKTDHLFETAFYEKTLAIRNQLVSPEIKSSNVFPWIKSEKLNLKIKSKRVHLISGQDDVVIGAGGMEALEFNLKELGNIVTSNMPKSLPHHMPGLAAPHIYHFIKTEFQSFL